MRGLDETQVKKLHLLFLEWLGSLSLPSPGQDELEIGYTGDCILPRVEEFAKTLKKDFIVVRGDGGTPALPLTVDGLQFYPDIEIVGFSQRYIALEVKILRGMDYTGSLAKAIGQALIYASLGVKRTHVLLVDQRSPGTTVHDPELSRWLEAVRTRGIDVHWFAPSTGGLFRRLPSA